MQVQRSSSEKKMRNVQSKIEGGAPDVVLYGDDDNDFRRTEFESVPGSGESNLKNKKDRHQVIDQLKEAVNADKIDMISPEERQHLLSSLNSYMNLLKNKVEDNKKVKKEDVDKVSMVMGKCASWRADLVPCDPTKYKCPTREERLKADVRNRTNFADIYTEIDTEIVDENGNKKYGTVKCPCVVPSARVRLEKVSKLNELHSVSKVMKRLKRALPRIKKQKEYLQAVKNCGTFRTRELCEMVGPDGKNKCRVEKKNDAGDVVCVPTLMTLENEYRTIVNELLRGGKKIDSLALRLENFEKEHPNLMDLVNKGILPVESAKDEKGNNVRKMIQDYKTTKGHHATLNSTHQRFLAKVREIVKDHIKQTEQFRMAMSIDSICQARERKPYAKVSDCMIDGQEDMCIIANPDEKDSKVYDSAKNMPEKGDYLEQHGTCVSRVGMNLTHTKIGDNIEFIDKVQNILNMGMRTPKWWLTNASEETRAALVRAVEQSMRETYNIGREMELKQRLLDLISDIVIAWKQTEGMLTTDGINKMKTAMDWKEGKIVLGAGGSKAALKKLDLKKENFAGNADENARLLIGPGGIAEYIIESTELIRKNIKKLQKTHKSAVSNLIESLIEGMAGMDYVSDSNSIRKAIVNGLNQTNLNNLSYMLAHDIVKLYSAHRFTDGEIVYHYPKTGSNIVTRSDCPKYVVINAFDNKEDKIRVRKIELGNSDIVMLPRHSFMKRYVYLAPEGVQPTSTESKKDDLTAGADSDTENSCLAGWKLTEGKDEEGNVIALEGVEFEESDGNTTIKIDPHAKTALQLELDKPEGWGSFLVKGYRAASNWMGYGLNGTLLNLFKTEQIDHANTAKLQKLLKTYTSEFKTKTTVPLRISMPNTKTSSGGMSGLRTSIYNIPVLPEFNTMKHAEEFFDESLMSTENIDASFMSTTGVPSLMSTERSENISLMSTEGTEGSASLMSTEGTEGSASLMSTEGSEGSASLMSTEKGEEFSLMSTYGNEPSLMSTATKDISLLSTEGGVRVPSMMSTTSPSSGFMSTYGDTINSQSLRSKNTNSAHSEELIPEVETISMPSIKSLSEKSLDVDKLYAEYYNNASTTSSVSHI